MNESDYSNNKDPEDNKKKIMKKLKAYERISERTNDYEEEIQNNNSYLNQTQSQKEISDIRESETNQSNYQNSQIFDNQSELEEKELNYINSEIIASVEEEDMILNKINKHGKEINFNLIYKALNDSDRAEIFHQKCDSAIRSLVLIETLEGKRFGGYTTQKWEGDGIEKNDNEAFIFSLDKKEIYNIISGKPAIGCYPKYGPVFLGCQIKINDNFFVKGGTTYRKYINYATNSDFELNGGIKFYGIRDIEVFEVNLI